MSKHLNYSNASQFLVGYLSFAVDKNVIHKENWRRKMKKNIKIQYYHSMTQSMMVKKLYKTRETVFK